MKVLVPEFRVTMYEPLPEKWLNVLGGGYPMPAARLSDGASVVAPLMPKLAMQPSAPKQFVLMITSALCVPLTTTEFEAAVAPVSVDVYVVDAVVPLADCAVPENGAPMLPVAPVAPSVPFVPGVPGVPEG